MRCVSHTGYLAHENSKGEIRGKSRYENNSKRVLRNMEERNEGAKREKCLKQNLTSAKDLTIMLLDGGDSPYAIDQTKVTIVTYCLIYGPSGHTEA